MHNNHGIRSHRASEPQTDGVDEGAHAEIHEPFGGVAENTPPEGAPYITKGSKRKFPPRYKARMDKDGDEGRGKFGDQDEKDRTLANDKIVSDDI